MRAILKVKELEERLDTGTAITWDLDLANYSYNFKPVIEAKKRNCLLVKLARLKKQAGLR